MFPIQSTWILSSANEEKASVDARKRWVKVRCSIVSAATLHNLFSTPSVDIRLVPDANPKAEYRLQQIQRAKRLRQRCGKISETQNAHG